MLVTRQQLIKAVEDGASWVKSRQNSDGSYGRWGPGSTCLAVMALINSGLPNTEPAAKNAITNILNTTPYDNTYFRSLTVMALIANGSKSPDILDRVQSDVQWLIESQAGNPMDVLSYGAWGPCQNTSFTDISNMQYAILALYSAACWGITVPQETWRRAIIWYQRNHAVNNDGSYVYCLDNSLKGGNVSIAPCMTAAALSGLKAINSFSLDPYVQTKADSLINGALKWLAENYVISLLPDIPDSWYYYYLFSLANGCVIGRTISFLGTKDWYADMAAALASLQKSDGRWVSKLDKTSTDVIHTSFSLLALTGVYAASATKIMDNEKAREDLTTVNTKNCIAYIKAGEENSLYVERNSPILEEPGNDAMNRCWCGPPVLVLSLLCPTPEHDYFYEGNGIAFSLILTNYGGTTGNVNVLDKIHIPPGVSIGNFATQPAAQINPQQSVYEDTDILLTWNLNSVWALSSIQMTVSFTLLSAPVQEANIVNLDAGINELSSSDNFICKIPVKRKTPQPIRGLTLQRFIKLHEKGKIIIHHDLTGN